jgi:hypothetical protein
VLGNCSVGKVGIFSHKATFNQRVFSGWHRGQNEFALSTMCIPCDLSVLFFSEPQMYWLWCFSKRELVLRGFVSNLCPWNVTYSLPENPGGGTLEGRLCVELRTCPGRDLLTGLRLPGIYFVEKFSVNSVI